MGIKSKDYKDTGAEWALMWLPYLTRLQRDNLFESAPALRCPVYFLLAERMSRRTQALQEKYYNNSRCPKKQLYWFERSGHSLPSTEPGLVAGDYYWYKEK
jgi:hypothetical protein